MIEVLKKNQLEPYKEFYSYLNSAISNNQKFSDAIAISSFNKKNNEVSSRFVNLKFIDDEEWIFFSNYNSKKASDFASHDQISAIFYWESINIQVRIKAIINKTSKEFNKKYFLNRSEKKNALAISSNQSKPIISYEAVVENYNHSLNVDNLKESPDYWGGYSFTPYNFEFWKGHNARLNRRDVYEKQEANWSRCIIQP